MTLEEWALQQLISRGIWPDQARLVLALYEKGPVMSNLRINWDYPYDPENPVCGLLWPGLKRCALEWIDANQPMAFYRPLFV